MIENKKIQYNINILIILFHLFLANNIIHLYYWYNDIFYFKILMNKPTNMYYKNFKISQYFYPDSVLSLSNNLIL
jgi:hypothetical protein